MPLPAPMIGHISRGVLNPSNPNLPKQTDSPANRSQSPICFKTAATIASGLSSCIRWPEFSTLAQGCWEISPARRSPWEYGIHASSAPQSTDTGQSSFP
ncbi:hypothetical protein WR25_17301 [Diploscapter pachys]|uniref:Uncharacterized protein n=1 Tax=Diploscapter pachys TaxID=2018661 RepID=A0A2A2K7L8_9BILA|nr:hypothetical protein WR25_17301 [Diploscapter pachys]